MWLNLVRVGNPEGFPLVCFAEVQGSESAEGVGSVVSPSHAAAFEALSDDGLAGGFDGSGADLPAVLQIIGIVRPLEVVA